MADFDDLAQLEYEATSKDMLLPGQPGPEGSTSLGAEVRRRQRENQQRRPTTADGRKLTMAAMTI